MARTKEDSQALPMKNRATDEPSIKLSRTLIHTQRHKLMNASMNSFCFIILLFFRLIPIFIIKIKKVCFKELGENG